ncbi:MAG: septum formation initiator family protein [Oscillospiraceae bacterium]|jgi:cell division protein FtsB|nr:septum formation initiator family protein [Oscillospiraceae bacterium]
MQMLPRPKQGKPKHIILKALVVALVVYAFYAFVQTNMEIKRGRERLDKTRAALKEIHAENEQLERYSSGDNIGEYMERVARDEMGYADPQERVYYVVPGN